VCALVHGGVGISSTVRASLIAQTPKRPKLSHITTKQIVAPRATRREGASTRVRTRVRLEYEIPALLRADAAQANPRARVFADDVSGAGGRVERMLPRLPEIERRTPR
jgi:hypothetical protein